MEKEYDKIVVGYSQKLGKIYIFKFIRDDGNDDDDGIKKYIKFLHLGAFILSNSKRILNQIEIAIDFSNDNKVFHRH